MQGKAPSYEEKFSATDKWNVRIPQCGIRIPRPSKSLLAASSVSNGIIGAGLAAAGFISGSRLVIGLGVLGIAGSILLRRL